MKDSPEPRPRHTEPGGGRYDHLLEHIQDAVVEFELVDGAPIIRAVNAAFVDIFGYTEDQLIGDSLNDWIVPEWLLDEAQELDQQTSSSEVTYRQVRRETATGLKEFLYRGIPYDDPEARTDGIALYTELTEMVRSERRLQVMNRILRHNLRNSANLVVGHTTQLLNEIDTQREATTDIAATVENAAHDLETLAKEARDIHTVLEKTPPEDPATDIVPLIERIVSEYRSHSPSARIETELPSSRVVKTDRSVRYALDSVVENAITHNPAEKPRVRLRVAATSVDGWVDVLVDDDGPRIPKTEREVITGAVDITQMQHGSGLGLWLAKWAIENFGGELSFAESDMDGNRVQLRLPNA